MKHGIIIARLSNTKEDNTLPADSKLTDDERYDISVRRQVDAGHAYYKTRKDIVHNCSQDCYIEPKGHRSGTSDKSRPRFRAAMDRLANTKGEVVYCYDQTRLSRGEARAIIAEAQKRDHEFILDGKRVDLNIFADEVSVATLDFLNFFYARKTSHDQRKRIAAEKEAGAWVGRPPLGMTTQGKGMNRRLVVSQETYQANGKTRKYIDTVKAYFKLIAERVGNPRAAHILNDKGYRVRSRDGKPVLAKHRQLLKIKPAYYRGVIDADLLDRVLRVRIERAGRKQNGRTPRTYPPPLLWRLLFCDACGKRYTLFQISKSAIAYRHWNGDCKHETCITAHKIDEQVLERIDQVAKLDKRTKQAIARRALAQMKRYDDPADEHKRIKAELDKLESLVLRLDGAISEDKYLARRKELTNQLAAIPDAPLRPPTHLTEQDLIAQMESLSAQIRAEPDGNLRNRMACDIVQAVYLLDGKVKRIVWQQDFAQWFNIPP